MEKPMVFRVFVSSTFKDLEAERNILQEAVFPGLRDFCLARGARFQPIDLRWGVSGEASFDQQAMNICLDEIRRCQEVTPRPNFVVLLGNRHGWLAPPPQIPATEFEQIRDHTPAGASRDLLTTWYAKDDNAVPAEYYLRPRDAQFRDQGTWDEVEGRLGAILRAAAAELDLPQASRLRYTASATEQEIVASAVAAGAAGGRAFAFIRELTGDYPNPASAARGEPILDFADPDQAPLAALKERLESALPVRRYQARWDPREGRPTTAHLAEFVKDVREALEAAILAELKQPTPLSTPAGEPGRIEVDPALRTEGLAHRDFAEERARIFVGREDSLAEIARYLDGADRRPLAVRGDGGSGKSALLAEALRRALRDHPGTAVVYRFIGATPESSAGRTLLRGLCIELARRGYGAAETAVPAAYPDLVTDFRERLGQATAERPLIMFLDSLDQLSASQGARELAWLPVPLPDGVRLVASSRPEDTLQALVSGGALVQELGPMPASDGLDLLRRWLGQARRGLRDAQEKQVLASFAASAGNPLYLRLAFEEARRWKSDERPGTLAAGVQAIIEENTFARLAEQDNHGTVLVTRALGYLAASRNGLTEDELLDLLSRDPDVYEWFLRGAHHIPPDLASQAAAYQGASAPPTGWLEEVRVDPSRAAELRRFLGQVLSGPDGPRLPVVLWSRLAFDLRPYLTERGAEEAVLISFFHRELADAAAEYLGGRRAADYHSKLADYFTPPVGEDDRPGWAGASLHALSELPYHLVKAGENRLGDLEDTLTDFGFLEAKASRVGIQRDENGSVLGYSGVHLLQDDFDLALAEMPGEKTAGSSPVIVTATDFGDGPVIRCPHCNTVHKIQRSWLGDGRLTCPNEACGAPLRVNPFIAGHGGKAGIIRASA